ncbi:GNAT family N-acetyltransferase [Stagnihabitans tardus]|uniref:GNAT family N-acetyltransferase n=1 Tax=Stagnihabitans tardus TaxID=2699202 RepID=A0AAE4YCZ4_9RHOB|nr:GNAT family N-acetyltransferase [Stagnihabitans tardus]NBZ87360.1 GNAT family N-acetyltransferase [Stagnihabitans tardus]
MHETIPEWALTADDEAQIAGLLARCFDTDFGGRSFFQTRQHLRIVHRAPGIVAHMAVQFRAMRLGSRLITVAGLGDVATDPSQRGKGLAGALLTQAIEVARQSPAEFFLLFGDRPLYAGAGFRPMRNMIKWCEMRGAVTGEIMREPAESLMVLELKGSWDETAELDLLGNLF